jgi:hypothetical protein
MHASGTNTPMNNKLIIGILTDSQIDVKYIKAAYKIYKTKGPEGLITLFHGKVTKKYEKHFITLLSYDSASVLFNLENITPANWRFFPTTE